MLRFPLRPAIVLLSTLLLLSMLVSIVTGAMPLPLPET